MSISPLLRKIFLVDLLKGLSITFKYQDPKDCQTEQYPQERPVITDRFRGQPLMKLGENGIDVTEREIEKLKPDIAYFERIIAHPRDWWERPPYGSKGA